MSDLPDLSPNPIKRFLSSPIWDGVSGVLAIVGFVLSIGAMWELVTGNVRVLLWLQATAYAVPVLVGVLMLVFTVAVFVFIAWRTVPDIDHFKKRQIVRREARYSERRRLIAGAVMLSTLTLALVVTVGYHGWLETPGTGTVVLIADFQGPDGQDSMHVTRQLVDEIRETLKEHPGIQVRTLGWPIEDRRGEGSDDAQRIGQLAKADIIVWGDYGYEPDLAVYVHFDLLNASTSWLKPETYRVYGDEQVQEVASAQIELSLPDTVAFNIALGEHLGTLVAFASGLALLENSTYAEAASIFDTATHVFGNPLAEPIEPYIHFMRAYTYHLMGDLQIPVVEYTATLESLDNIFAQTIALTPEKVLSNRGLARLAKGDLTNAISDFDQAIVLNPQYSVAYNNRGLARRDQGDLIGAISDYEQAIALNPQFAVAYYNRGLARRDQGDLTSAISDYGQAIALNPQYAAAYNNRGNARRFQGDLIGAISDFDHAIALNPQFAFAYNNRGNTRRAQGDLTGAISDFDHAIAFDPQYAFAYINRANARSDQGDLTGAISDCDQAIALDPQYAFAYNNRGNTRRAQGDLTGAISDCDQAIALDPQYAFAYNNRGAARSDQGDTIGAISDFDQAIALDPQFTIAYYNRGLVRRDQEDLTGAISDFDHVIALDPKNAAAYNNRGIARSDQGDTIGAISDFTRYLELAPATSNRSEIEQKIAELTAQLDGQP